MSFSLKGIKTSLKRPSKEEKQSQERRKSWRICRKCRKTKTLKAYSHNVSVGCKLDVYDSLGVQVIKFVERLVKATHFFDTKLL